MFKSHRIIAVAFAVAAFSATAQEQPQGRQGQAAEQGTLADTMPIPLPIEIVESQSEVDTRQRLDQEAREREVADLEAQTGMNNATQAMNDATQRMAGYAYWSTIFVAVGTVLLFVTLILSWLAISVSRKIGEKQVRAYIGIDAIKDIEYLMPDLTTLDEHHGIKATVIIKNYGASPALVTSFVRNERTIGTEVQNFTNVADAISGQADTGTFTLGPGSIFAVSVDNILQSLEAKSLLNGEAHSYFFGRIVYRDVFTAEHETEYCMRVENFGTDHMRLLPFGGLEVAT